MFDLELEGRGPLGEAVRDDEEDESAGREEAHLARERMDGGWRENEWRREREWMADGERMDGGGRENGWRRER